MLIMYSKTVPKRFNETTANKARVSVFEADNPTNSAIVSFPAYILESETGEIIYAALLVSQKVWFLTKYIEDL